MTDDFWIRPGSGYRSRGRGRRRAADGFGWRGSPSVAPPVFATNPLHTSPHDEEESDAPRRHYRTIWISDVHLGWKPCQAERLLHFLRHHNADRWYLVGDFVDGWMLKRSWFWPQEHNNVVQKILRKVRKGAQVICVPGNHDEFLLHFLHLQFGGITIAPEVMHVTADGRKLWILHGDAFDSIIQYAPWLASVGNNGYDLMIAVGRWLNFLRRTLGRREWSLSGYVKGRVKNLMKFIADYEHALVQQARKRYADGVVCGHIHKAQIRDFDGISTTTRETGWRVAPRWWNITTGRWRSFGGRRSKNPRRRARERAGRKSDRIRLVFLFGWILLLALLFAQAEIQIEGSHGWASSLPTWRIADAPVLKFLFSGHQDHRLPRFHLRVHVRRLPPAVCVDWSLFVEVRGADSRKFDAVLDRRKRPVVLVESGLRALETHAARRSVAPLLVPGNADGLLPVHWNRSHASLVFVSLTANGQCRRD